MQFELGAVVGRRDGHGGDGRADRQDLDRLHVANGARADLAVRRNRRPVARQRSSVRLAVSLDALHKTI